MASKSERRRLRLERQRRKKYAPARYTEKTLHEDREYGFYWYSWLWRVLRPVLIFLCSLLIVLGGVSFGWSKINEAFLMAVEPSSNAVVPFTIESGESVTSIGTRLQKANLLRSPSIFKYLIQFRGLTNSISYGTYNLSPSMDVNDVIAELASGSQSTERTITIIPGWTCENIADYLVEEGALANREEFLRLCNRPNLFVSDSYALRSAQEADSLKGRKYALEGYLAPDTYRVFSNASAESIIRTLLTQTNSVVDKVFYTESPDYYTDAEGTVHEVERYKTTLSQDETIILASMIQREAKTNADYTRVSAVFHNRLNAGWRLESDPTVTYLSGVNKLALSTAETSAQNNYNTYVINGLPAGPICNPSVRALEAALYPDMEYIKEGYMYFCAKEPLSGELAFAITQEEHLANVAQYRPLWEAYDQQQAEKNSATGASGDNTAAP